MIQVQPLSQRDDRWKLKRLGEGTGTIGSYGCTLTSITVAINAFGAGLGVDDANEKLKAVKGFGGTTNNLVIWAKLPEAFPQIKSVNFPQPYNNTLAKQMLDKGYPVIVKVNGASIGATSHWCLLIGDQKMVDPWTGKIVPTSTYPILSLVVWELQKSESMNELEACLTAHKQAMDAIFEKDKQIASQKTMIENLKGELSSCNTLRNQGVSALEHAEQELKVMNIEKEELQREITKTKEDLTLSQKMFNEKVEEISTLQKRVTELEGQLAGGKESDKPIPYKRLYEECQVEIGQYQALIDREYVKKAKSKLAQAIQKVAVDIESYILR